jgi:hypothetical protein
VKFGEITDTESLKKIETSLSKNPRRAKAAADTAAPDDEYGDDEAEAA